MPSPFVEHLGVVLDVSLAGLSETDGEEAVREEIQHLQQELERTQQLLVSAYTTIGKMHCGIED